MRFSSTRFDGVVVIEPEPFHDERGSFMRTFCLDAYSQHGLETTFLQHSTSTNRLAGTLRGLHFQRPPHAEIKVVRCLRGAVWDVVVDLRRASSTFRHWQGFELSAANRHQLYIPRGFAHGFQTLMPDTEVGYLISDRYAPDAAAGLRFDDPALAIDWPRPVASVSEKDRLWPLLSAA